MTAIEWPDFIAPNSIDWWLDTPTRSGGQSILGNERIVATPAARWRATMTFRIWGMPGDPKRMLFWRAFSASMGGRAGSVTIGPFDKLTPAILEGISAVPISLSFDDGSIFSDGSTFTEPPSGTGPITLALAAAVGANSIRAMIGGAVQPQAGQYFGLGGTEMHMIAAATNNLDDTFTLTIAPPIRAAWSAGAVLDFDTPRATMRLAADDTARQKITIGGVADVTLELIEVF